MRSVIKKKGQIWVETVIYTLIGLAIIGLVMAAALPKINQKKDEIIIEQSIEALGNIDDKIYEVQRAPGNRRVVDLEIRKGILLINAKENQISWVLESSFPYSQEGVEVPLGKMTVNTSKGNPWRVELKIDYDMDLMFDEDDENTKQLDPAPTPYKLMIERIEDNAAGNIVIDMNEG